MIKCEICGREFRSIKGLARHITMLQKTSIKDYYDKYLKKENEEICNLNNCNNTTRFYGINYGYNKFCCKDHDIEFRKLHPPKTKLKCEICGRLFRDLTALMTHLYYVKNKNGHPKNKKEYYEKFLGREYKSKCMICGNKYKNLAGLASHFNRIHKISSKDYYDKYIRKENEGICKINDCDQETHFVSIGKGYLKFCCYEHFYISDEHCLNKSGEKCHWWLENRKTAEEKCKYISNKKFRNSIKENQNYLDPITNEQLKYNASLHHIDYNKRNNSRENLIFLNCSTHAKTTIGNRKYWTKKLTKINKQIIDKTFKFNGDQKN